MIKETDDTDFKIECDGVYKASVIDNREEGS